MQRTHPIIAPEIVSCITEGRKPTVHELCRVADQIADDLQPFASAFAWGGNIQDSSVRLINMRMAIAALGGVETSD